MSKKIAFVIPSLDSGGIETYLLRFLFYIKNNDQIESYVIVRNSKKGILYSKYRDLNISIIYQPLGYINIFNFISLYRVFNKYNFDVLVEFDSSFSGIPIFIAKLTNIKKRITFYRHSSDRYKPNFLKNIYNDFLKYLVNKYSTKILSNSEAALNYYFPFWRFSLKFDVVYNGINVKEFKKFSKKNNLRSYLRIPENAFVISHTGRLDNSKNHKTILAVANQLINKDKNIYFVLCGMGTEELGSKIHGLNIFENIKLLGYRDDVPEILNMSDLFYFPSITEGQPNSLIESLICGKPFVASNIDSIKEMLPHELHKYLIAPQDINNAVNLILFIKNNYSLVLSEVPKEWASKQFSQDSRFSDFLRFLI